MIRLLLVSILFLGCSDHVRYLSKEELNSYVMNPENGLLKRVTKERTVFELVYRPKDQVIGQTAGTDGALWVEEQERVDSLDYFILRLSRDSKEIENHLAGDVAGFNRAIAYLSGGISSDIRMMLGNEVLLPEQSVYVPTFGSTGVTSIMLVFKSSLHTRKGAFTVVFDDTLIGTGTSEFSFSCSHIRNIPRLRH